MFASVSLRLFNVKNGYGYIFHFDYLQLKCIHNTLVKCFYIDTSQKQSHKRIKRFCTIQGVMETQLLSSPCAAGALRGRDAADDGAQSAGGPEAEEVVLGGSVHRL